MELSNGTKKMLEGLDSGPVSIGDLASYIAQAGVFVSVHVGRCRGTLTLPPKAVGVRVDRMNDEAKTAYKSIVRLGNLTFVSAEDENKLVSIETALRRKLYDLSTVDGFMPSALFEQFKDEFKQAKEDYMAQRDKIVEKWDAIIADFGNSLRTMLAGIRMLQRDRKRLYEAIMKSLPSKERYADSFEVSMTVKAFPAIPLCDTGLPGDVQAAVKDSWNDMTVALAEKSIISLLVDVFDAASEVVKGYMKTGSIHGRRLNTLAKLGQRLERMNLFRNSMVADTATLLVGLKSMTPEQAEAQLEQCIVNIYRYADSVGYELGLENCPFDQETLEAYV